MSNVVSDWPKYRVTFSVQENDGNDEYVEIGFGAADFEQIDACAYAVGTMLQRREWETTGDMPKPEDVNP